MKIILKKNYENLGKAGDIVNVKDGYFRNYLGPNSIAIAYSKGAAKQIEMLKSRAKKFADEKREKLLYLKDQLEKQEISFTRKVAEGGRLFGSITNIDIFKELSERNFDIDKKAIKLEEHLKMVGEYRIPVELTKDIVAELNIEIKEEEE